MVNINSHVFTAHSVFISIVVIVLFFKFSRVQQNKNDRESLEDATTSDHVTAVTADFQACIKDGTVSQIVRQRTLYM